MFVRPPIPIRKQMSLVVYRLVHGLPCKAISNLYGCGESTIIKYTLIGCRVLSYQDSLFKRYINIPTRQKLVDIIRKFYDMTGLPNVVCTIDGTYIPLSYRSQRGLTPMSCDFFNKKKFHSVLLQVVCDSKRFFGMFVQDNRGEYIMLRSLHGQKFIHNYEDEIYCLIQF